MKKFDQLKQELLKEMAIDEKLDKKKNVDKIIVVASGLSAGIAVQPLPMADFPVLTTIEIVMVKRIGEIYGYDFTLDRAKEILIEIGGVVGMAVLAKNAIITGYKTVIPFAGGFFTIPLVFGSCFAIGRVADYYFTCKSENKLFDKKMAKSLFQKSKKEGEYYGENHQKKEI